MDENQDIETADNLEPEVIEHVNSCYCECQDCKSGRKRYVQIIDVDTYIQNLNDWD